MNEILREKVDELAKINSKASESLSELSEAEECIKYLETHSKGLETKIERLEREGLKLEKLKIQIADLKIMSEKELAAITPKKGVFGKEYVELTKEQADEGQDINVNDKPSSGARSGPPPKTYQ